LVGESPGVIQAFHFREEQFMLIDVSVDVSARPADFVGDVHLVEKDAD
jgi:hypothetical protein